MKPSKRPKATPAAEATEAPSPLRRVEKSSTAFRTISEVAQDLDVPQHVLRFWESRFAQIRPLKRGGGRRYYRPEDIALLRLIRSLLYEEGYTIKGVQKLMREGALKQRLADLTGGAPPPRPAGPSPAATGEERASRAQLRELLAELESLRDRLQAALR
jgi:DNA-binding transcriptional MerR regulator